MQIPDYVEDEIQIYLRKKKLGKSGIATLYNALALVDLATFSNRITDEEGEKIKEYIRNL